VVTIGYIAIGNVTNPNGVTQLSDSYYKAGDGSGKLSVSLLGGVAADLEDSAGAALSYLGGAGGDTDGKADLQILSAGTTTLITGGLEMSKTDLATEISEMITTQRGYQANTRIITVTDSMLEELVNMKR
jgi:flagellar hook protein FlgE